MPKSLILTEDAQQDLDGAYQWYEDQNQGLGQEFMRCIDAKLSEVNRNPLHHQIIYSSLVRRALTSRFPVSFFHLFCRRRRSHNCFCYSSSKKKP